VHLREISDLKLILFLKQQDNTRKPNGYGITLQPMEVHICCDP